MKVLFVQLSDMHCQATDRNNCEKISKAVQAVKTLGKIDGAVLIFSGDLSNSAKKSEFDVGRQMLGKFLHDLGEALDCGAIKTAIVPGNHDLYLPDGCRDAKEIEAWNKQEHIEEELKRLNKFYAYSRTKYCFENDKLCDKKLINIAGIKIQLCLLNSALFSTKKPDDKEFHYLPQSIKTKLKRDDAADIKITVMHHHFEWCEWDTKEMLKKAIASDDITFFGHDHKSEHIDSIYSDGKVYRIIMGGEFSIGTEKEASFNATVYDTEKAEFYQYSFEWNKESEIFTRTDCGTQKKKAQTVSPTDEYLKNLLKDPQNISDSILDYFVFPKLTAEGEAFDSVENAKGIAMKDIFSALACEKTIRIIGNAGYGKSSLLRVLYHQSISEGYIPLMIERRNYKNSKIEKMLVDLFEEQYGIDERISKDYFEQIDNSKIIIFIDDVDLIDNQKARVNLINWIIDYGFLLIYTTKEKDQNIEEIVKNKLQGKEISSLNIPPMYKESRDNLIERIGQALTKKDDDIDTIKAAFDYLCQSQANLFSFTPGNALQYIKYFMQNGCDDKSASQTMSVVFETNIRTAIINASKADAVVPKYLSALEFLANRMYFDYKVESVDVSRYTEIISEYNQKRRADINPKRFLDICKNANVLMQKDDSFDVFFYDKNTYAYFVAKSLNREFEKDNTKLDKLSYVMDHICFGINDIIVVFLSFIRSNSNIIVNIANKAMELLNDYSEWNLDENNLPFMQSNTDMSKDAPSNSEKQKNTEEVERIEQERHNAIKFKGIFDYNENDISKTQYVISRAFKYMQIVARALIDQYGSLETEEIDLFLNAIFVIPQQAIYAILKPYQDNYDKIVDSIMRFVCERIPDEKIDEKRVRKMLANTATVLALNIMNDIAFNASNPSTISVLRTGPDKSSNYKVMKLMMEENVGNTPSFVDKAIDLRKEMKDNQYAQSLISQIARKHILYHKNIEFRQIDRLISANVLSSKSKVPLLMEKGSQDKS